MEVTSLATRRNKRQKSMKRKHERKKERTKAKKERTKAKKASDEKGELGEGEGEQQGFEKGHTVYWNPKEKPSDELLPISDPLTGCKPNVRYG